MNRLPGVGIDPLRLALRSDRLEVVAETVASLGHEVIAREIDVTEAGEVTNREQPDVALVELGESSGHAIVGSTPAATVPPIGSPVWRTPSADARLDGPHERKTNPDTGRRDNG